MADSHTQHEPTFAERCVFTATLRHGCWWLDRVNPHGRTEAAVGPYPDEVEALRAANRMNQINQAWVTPDDE